MKTLIESLIEKLNIQQGDKPTNIVVITKLLNEYIEQENINIVLSTIAVGRFLKNKGFKKELLNNEQGSKTTYYYINQ